MKIDAQELVRLVTVTRPALLIHILNTAKPYLKEIEDECRRVQFGSIDFTLMVRGGEVEVMEITEKRKWKRQAPPIDAKPEV